ncbi:hypothetical protein [Paractinoplanes rishiriensis]|uniref:Proteinase inhibitor I36 SMPI n=1 Tax=Paractinoplanes rishiriensis TaxID=1050105 RepID=A0A919KAJ0_9ACTN|nr:hypothetical protein [Actinoplanes rishiriensis]GIF01906.1 hypothetical protein Ari01nite_93700 [Actinoplanes rishiriensis]
MSTLFKRIAVGTVLAAAAALLPAASAAAAATVPCDKGYVCIALAKGTIIWVPEGQSHDFPGGADMAAITNQTETPYCVGGSPNFGLAPGVEIVRDQPVFGFNPGRVCLT